MLKYRTNNQRLCGRQKYRCAALIFLICCILTTACNTGNGNINDNVNGNANGEKRNVPVSPAPTETVRTFAAETYLDGNSITGMTFNEGIALAEKLRSEAQTNYECTLLCGDTEYKLSAEDIELSSNAEELLKRALNEGAGRYELNFTPLDTPKLREALKTISDKTETPPAAPDFTLNIQKSYENIPRFLPVNEKDGSRLDTDGTVNRILAGETVFSPPVEPIKYAGDISTEFPELLAAFSTSFNAKGLNSKGRVHNLKKASEIINGTVVAPGKRFSCSKTLGERSKKNGWAPASAFSNGGTETVNKYGGGICQISTTLYNTVLRADLKVVARRAHTKKVRYIDGGLDAAISGDNVDFIWENNTSNNVYVFMWVNDNDNSLHCELYGQIPDRDFDEIIIESEFIGIIAPTEPEFIVDSKLKPGECVLKSSAVNGKIYRAYKLYTKNGRILRKTLIDETQYLMHPPIYAVSPQE